MSDIPHSAQKRNSITQPLLSENPQLTRPFECYRCLKRFSSTHALGGHQNAHKKERNEECRLYMEQRRALEKQQSPVTIASPAPLPFVQPHGSATATATAKGFCHFAQPAAPAVLLTNSVPSHDSILVHPLSAGFIYTCPRGHVLMPVGYEYGPTRAHVKGAGEVPYKGFHPYKKPAVDKKPILPYLNNESRHFWAEAEEDTAFSNAYYYFSSATTEAAGPFGGTFFNGGREYDTSKKEELDLTLRL